MSFLLLILIFFVSTFLIWLRWIRSAIVAFTLGSIWLFCVGCGILGHFLLESLQAIDRLQSVSWGERNAIVVLGMGEVRWPKSKLVSTHPFGFSRIYEAQRLYLACKTKTKSCSIVASGGDPGNLGEAEARTLKRELEDVGIVGSDILVEDKSLNTYQNAEFSSRLLIANHFDQVVLATSGVHLRRSLKYFAHWQIKAVGAPSDRMEVIFSAIPSAYNFALTDIALHEFSGLLRYKIYNYLGWNYSSPNPGSS